MQDLDFPLELKHTALYQPVNHVLLVVFLPKGSRNCMTTTAQHELEKIFAWLDKNPDLRCAVITGAGRMFLSGGDLHEWYRLNHKPLGLFDMVPRRGFAGLTGRFGKKPVIAAVNGPAFGGGFEMLMGVDMIIASSNATFSLPEVKRGVLAFGGCLPRLMKNVGRQRAMEMALVGDSITAERAHQWGLVNEIVAENSGTEDVLKRPVVLKAVEYAQKMARHSPDSVILSRTAVLLGHEQGSAEAASWFIGDMVDQGFDENPNLQEGLAAFVEKRKPVWRPSKL
ncbi:ClpP/crotonase-like domain-containing protein [Aspergillus ambiguus]|uniref:enoyl-CoA hydratase/isomerase family protein n=1 Tax=Aspergillus ambiguus TaxID=176160 RepID=UPI003CCD3122